MAVDAICSPSPSTPQLTCRMKTRRGEAFHFHRLQTVCLLEGIFQLTGLTGDLRLRGSPLQQSFCRRPEGLHHRCKKSKNTSVQSCCHGKRPPPQLFSLLPSNCRKKLHRTFSAATEIKEMLVLIFSHYSTMSLKVPQVLKLLQSSRSGQESSAAL